LISQQQIFSREMLYKCTKYDGCAVVFAIAELLVYSSSETRMGELYLCTGIVS